MAGKGGGAWKVAYADFVTAMMAFFMVMWLVGQNSKIKEAVAEHFQHDPLEELIHNDSVDENRETGGPRRGNGRFGKRKGETAKSVSPSESPLDPTDIKPRVLMLHNTERTGLAALVPFAAQSSDLSDEGKRRIGELLPLIDGKPHKIEVRGHCSEPPADVTGPDDIWKLAFTRALAVQHYMTSQGVPAERMRLSVAGRHEPFTLKEDREYQARNERVEVYLLNEFVEDLQGTKAEREKRLQQSTTGYSLTKADDAAPSKTEKKPAAKDDHDHGH